MKFPLRKFTGAAIENEISVEKALELIWNMKFRSECRRSNSLPERLGQSVGDRSRRSPRRIAVSARLGQPCFLEQDREVRMSPQYREALAVLRVRGEDQME